MRKIAMIVGLVSVLATSAHAFGTSSSNIFGGYDYWMDGTSGTSSSNIFGGLDFYGPLFD